MDLAAVFGANSTEINIFETQENGVSVTIATRNLNMRSVTKEDYNNFIALFGDAEVMSKFAIGKTKTRDETIALVDGWIQGWRDGDPYSGFAVFKNGTGEFLGYAILGHGNCPGEAELAGLGRREFWNQGYGKEVAAALVHEYALETVRGNYRLKGALLTKIVATARPDNETTIKIVEQIGMELIRKEKKFGVLRHLYAIDVLVEEADGKSEIEERASLENTAKRHWCTLL